MFSCFSLALFLARIIAYRYFNNNRSHRRPSPQFCLARVIKAACLEGDWFRFDLHSTKLYFHTTLILASCATNKLVWVQQSGKRKLGDLFTPTFFIHFHSKHAQLLFHVITCSRCQTALSKKIMIKSEDNFLIHVLFTKIHQFCVSILTQEHSVYFSFLDQPRHEIKGWILVISAIELECVARLC